MNKEVLEELENTKFPLCRSRKNISSEGVQAFEMSSFDLVLMDIQMPEMGGIEAAHLIREIEQSRNLKPTPIIAVTANALKGDREKCLEAGASDYIAKPVKSAQLLSLLRMWLHR